ncbi:class I SAM-dependent methyltransferase [Thalassotalea nanhaiensis]|uniref:Class I SAM-dependent methyltransferase n=1 Tax=Thalassotalea nanhaiensis TaxID=3065648 RepID=A0ABY9THR6_9GAMM|nr:class I SAM-dependent methyltransferase [Colwelliaceae bacterium SQ345]
MIEHINFSAVDPIECQRLFHGRGHAFQGFKHVNVDWLPPVALITLYQEESDEWLQDKAQQLFENIKECTSVMVQFRCRHKGPYQLLLGEEKSHLTVVEHGLKYQLQLGNAQNNGLFLDMSNGRKWVKENSQNKTVLNLFAYTCAFSVAAIAGGASKVVNVDISKAPLAKGRDNHRANKQELGNVKFEGVDIFKSYGRLKKHGPYDLLISDPPSFQKGSVDIKRDYPKIIRRLPQLMNDQGLVMLCLNSPDLSEQFIHDMIETECPQCEFIENILPPEVFKEAMPGKGLKVLIFKYHANKPAN